MAIPIPDVPPPLSDEVRVCARCSQPTVVLAFEWQHTTFGVATGEVTRDFRCQNCGKKYTVRSRSKLIAWWIVGVLLIPALVGLPVLVVAWRLSTMAKRIPVQPGAPVPPMRYRGGPPLRRCAACTQPAISIKVTRNTHNGIPTGTEYEYQCSGCDRSFTIESAWGMVVNGSVGGLVLAGAVGFLVGADHPGWKYGGAAVCGLIGLALVYQVTRRLSARFRNGVLTAPSSPMVP